MFSCNYSYLIVCFSASLYTAAASRHGLNPDFEAELMDLTHYGILETLQVTPIARFLTACPSMHLTESSPTRRSLGYSLLGNFLHYIAVTPMRVLLTTDRARYLDLLDALFMFPFDSQWLADIRAQVISPSEDSIARALE